MESTEPVEVQPDLEQVEPVPEPTTETTNKDDFGRDARPTPAVETKQIPFEQVRHLVDAEINLTCVKELSPENKTNAMKIAQYLSRINSTRMKMRPDDIVSLCSKLFKEYSTYDEIIVKLFMDAIAINNTHIEILAAIIGYYTGKFCENYRKRIITEYIPEQIKLAFKEDRYTSLKAYLHFYGAFVAYGIVTAASYVNLLKTIIDKIDTASPLRAEAICRAVLFAIRVSPPTISDDESGVGFKDILDKVSEYIGNRLDGFIARYSPSKDARKSMVDLLFESPRIDSLADAYAQSELFDSPVDEAIPDIELEFGEVDRAPFPIVPLPVDIGDLTAVALDLCFDTITFYAQDTQIVAQQLLAVPLIVGLGTMMLDTCGEPETAFIPAIFTAIFSNLCMVPHSPYPPSFHSSVIRVLFTNAQTDILRPFNDYVMQLFSGVSQMEIGCMNRAVKLIAHLVTSTDKGEMIIAQSTWDTWRDVLMARQESDLRYVYMTALFDQIAAFSSSEFIQTVIEPSFAEIIAAPPPPEPENDVKALRAKLDENIDEAQSFIQEIVGKEGEYKALHTILHAIFMPANGAAEIAIKEFDMFFQFITERFGEADDKSTEWKKTVMFGSTWDCFANQPTTMCQVICHIVKRYCKSEYFLKWFFNISQCENFGKTRYWDILGRSLTSIFALLRSLNRFDDMKETMLELFVDTHTVLKEAPLDALSERLLFGNVREIALAHADLFAAITENVAELIMGEDTNKDFKELVNSLAAICA